MRIGSRSRLLILMICLTLSSSGCGKTGISVGGFQISGMKSHELLAVGEETCPMAAAMIFVTTQKNIYQDSYSGDIWSVQLEDGTFESYALEAIKSYMGHLFTVAKLARAEGYSLTEEEEIQVSEAAAHYIASMSAKDLELTGITEEVAQAAYEQYVLALRFYDDMIEEAGIEISDDEARVIHIQKILIAAEGLTGEEREAQRAKAQEALEKAKNSTDFVAVASGYQDGDSLEFTVTREDLTPEEEEVAYRLKNGQISEIIETEKGFVIIKCLSSYDESATAVYKEKLLEERRSTVFDGRIKAFLEEYPAVFNDGAWATVSISGYQGPATGNFYTSYQTCFSQ